MDFAPVMPIGTIGLAILILLGICLLVTIVGFRRGRHARGGHVPVLPPEADRQQVFEEKRERQKAERARILRMVNEHRITPEEGADLMEALNRETTHRTCPFCQETILLEAVKCRHCKSFLTERTIQATRHLSLGHDQMIAGVCSGVATYMNADVTLIRLLAFLVIFFSGCTGLIIYIILAMILPEPGTVART